ncbi:MAG: hypothetical protein FWD64_01170 [Acidobacteriaceae bacterium]|nr:hypothetical protein [Acidobacteriaceae bacterium]
MNWVREGEQWGLGMTLTDGKLTRWRPPVLYKDKGNLVIVSEYNQDKFGVKVRREITEAGQLNESYTFVNHGDSPVDFAEGDLGIRIPLPDNYPDSATCLTNRCNAHIWTGGGVSYIVAIRMGGTAPHLGVVLTSGSLASYSITDRPWNSNDRGIFVLHPGSFSLPSHGQQTFNLKTFWHTGWEDFFKQASGIHGFIRLSADHYTVSKGDTIQLRAESASFSSSPQLMLDGKAIPFARGPGTLTASITLQRTGEHTVKVISDGSQTYLRALVTEDPLRLIEARATFIVNKQQCNDQASPHYGSYLVYDNETHLQSYSQVADHNAGRERVGMGVLIALFLPLCKDVALKRELAQSLDRYWKFVTTKLQDEAGTVFDDADVPRQRLYNYPWVAHLHLAMFQNSGERKYCDWFLKTLRSFYAKGGAGFYCIGLPVSESLNELKKADLTTEYDEVLALYQEHADVLLRVSTDFPRSEVNYEQSIVAPAVQILAEVYLATQDRRYADGLWPLLRCLEAFNGQQPDYHLNDIAIRHWDDYWFGKRQLYGDTFPHYWSTITAVCFDDVARATRDPRYSERARNILANNLCLFQADGSASCTSVLPLTINGKQGRFLDPLANDQDWALVYYLMIHERIPSWKEEAANIDVELNS